MIDLINRPPQKGDLAICSIGCLGLITEDGLQEVNYPNGNWGLTYVGIHLTDKVSPIGSKWTSRNPKLVITTEDLLTLYSFKDND